MNVGYSTICKEPHVYLLLLLLLSKQQSLVFLLEFKAERTKKFTYESLDWECTSVVALSPNMHKGSGLDPQFNKGREKKSLTFQKTQG